MYTERELRKGLKTRTFGSKIYSFETLDSTNNCAKAVAGVGAKEGTVVIAELQTAGRGRLGRPWISNANENLTFSVVVRPRLTGEELNLLPLYAAVAVADAIEKVTTLRVECKWPNDLLINKRKVAGILIEGSFKENQADYVIIGVGINVNQVDFPQDLAQKATSLRLEAGQEVDRTRLFREVLRSLESQYSEGGKRGFRTILPTWLSRSTMIGKPIALSQQGTIIGGVVKGLTSEGGLILQTDGTVRTLFAGDVTIVDAEPGIPVHAQTT